MKRKRHLLCAIVMMLSISATGIARFSPAQDSLSTVASDGQELSYEVIDGLAIHAGDIILGTAEEVAAATSRLDAANPGTDSWSEPQMATGIKLGTLWPDGVIPYLIDRSVPVEGREVLLSAIEQWNTKTVITLEGRTRQKNYVRFTSDPSIHTCWSRLGMVGGEQLIALPGPCIKDRATIIHEIGHTVGLHHEHQRRDRDRYMMLFENGLEYLWLGRWGMIEDGTLNHGPYDFASIMHYPFDGSRWPHDTLPPGIPVHETNDESATLSVGDIDGVARMYGEPPQATTIVTHPAGLDIIVDGERVTTPATFEWAPGTTHRIEAPSPQMGKEHFRYVFGRWTDEGGRKHVITADPGTTWYQASFILQRRVVVQAEPEGAGTVTIRPDSPDGFYTLGSQIEVTAEKNPGSPYKFERWLLSNADFEPSFDVNPITQTVVGENYSRYGKPTLFRGRFTTDKCFLVDSNVGAPISLLFDRNVVGNRIERGEGSTFRDLPARFCRYGRVFVQVRRDSHVFDWTSPHTFFRFLSWSDGGSLGRWVSLPDGGKVTLNVAPHHGIRIENDGWSGGRIELSPRPKETRRGAIPGSHRPPPNTFYVDGTDVRLRAVPNSGHQFVGWGESVSGSDRVKNLVMDGYKSVKAYFTNSRQSPSIEPGRKERFSTTGSPSVSRRVVYVPPGFTEFSIEINVDTPAPRGILGVGRKPAHIGFDSGARLATDWADVHSPLRSGRTTIRVTPESEPWYSGGRPYFIAVAGQSGRIAGTLRVTLKGGPAVRAYPKALTFVSPKDITPDPQRFQLTNSGDGPLHFRIRSDQNWLTASPQTGFLEEGDSAEIDVMVNPSEVRPDTHFGNLKIFREDSDADDPDFNDGAPIPVTFAVIGPDITSLNFPHFANGSSITSEFVLLNATSSPIRPSLYFYDQSGEQITAESVVDVDEGLEVRDDGALGIRTELQPFGDLRISTHGRGSLVAGSARVVSDGPIGGVLRFDNPEIGVAGVGASELLQDAIFPARQQMGGIRTGIAIHNPDAEPVQVTCRLMQGGTTLEEGMEIPLAANGQTAGFIDQMFTRPGTSDFAGLVRCTAPDEGRFTGVAFEMDGKGRIFTTLPVVPVAPPATGLQETALDFAHFGNGLSNDGVLMTSDLVIMNVSATPVRPALYFFDPSGNLLAAESVAEVTGDLTVQEDGALTVRTELESLAKLTISTHGQGDLTTGFVRVVADGPIGGLLRFDIGIIGVAGVAASRPVNDVLFPARRLAGGVNTGAAVRNLGSGAVTVTCYLLQGGRVLETKDFPLAGAGQTAVFINELFPLTDTTDFLGSVRCNAPAPERFTGVALEMDFNNRIFTTMPLVPVQE